MTEYRWPIKELNDVLMPIRETDLVVIGSRPSQGKTTLMLNMAYRFARDGIKTAYVTLERSTAQLKERFVSSHFRDYEDAERLREELNRIPLFFFDLRDWAIDEVAYEIEEEKGSLNFDVCFVDYLQLISEREGEIDWFKELSLLLEIPIILGSQMKRTVLDNPGKVPQQKDFHDAEEINACADTIIMLHHERSYDDNAPKEELRDRFQRQRKAREPRQSFTSTGKRRC
ncbi:DnaB-like helicase C-terminal domain-containing protein [Mesotoga sp.]|uniref:DnaB-like helicase C-terminal domain-containing protein n=1 Tax=Mesotoga sp. TaxID=2053577 RepID=UPI00345E83D1